VLEKVKRLSDNLAPGVGKRFHAFLRRYLSSSFPVRGILEKADFFEQPTSSLKSVFFLLVIWRIASGVGGMVSVFSGL